MERNTLTHFIQYFRQLAAEHVELKCFVHGPTARIVDSSRSGTTYPCLWLETPSLQFFDKDGTAPNGQRRAAFVVLLQKAKGDYDAQDLQWEAAERLALDVLSRLRRDKKARRFTFSLDGGELEPINTLTVDNEIGYRFEFELGKVVELCYDKSRWQEGGAQA
ncbi:hypothetical protein [Hymenobacter coalescens]